MRIRIRDELTYGGHALGWDFTFSFAAYGPSEACWYYIGGFCLVTARLAIKLSPEAAGVAIAANRVRPCQVFRGRARLRFSGPRRV